MNITINGVARVMAVSACTALTIGLSGCSTYEGSNPPHEGSSASETSETTVAYKSVSEIVDALAKEGFTGCREGDPNTASTTRMGFCDGTVIWVYPDAQTAMINMPDNPTGSMVVGDNWFVSVGPNDTDRVRQALGGELY